MSNKDYGGKITMTLSSGERLSLRGTLNISPARNSAEAITNQDQSVDRTWTPKPAGFEINFADRGIDLDKLMLSPRFNVTFSEEHTGVTHYFTKAFMTGDPSTNRLTGEVSGISGACESYERKG